MNSPGILFLTKSKSENSLLFMASSSVPPEIILEKGSNAALGYFNISINSGDMAPVSFTEDRTGSEAGKKGQLYNFIEVAKQ